MARIRHAYVTNPGHKGEHRPNDNAISTRVLTIDVPKLGSNDRVIVATCRAAGISTIISNDHGFDSVPGLTRVDPLDADAVAALPAS
ncbi:MAG: type II toxin-antitoxin system VapC family toxin [Egibacteraceae bacterium]